MADFKAVEKFDKAVKSISAYYTAVIYSGSWPLKDTLIASGTFAIIGGKKGILTNWHVVQEFFIVRGSGFITLPLDAFESIKLRFDSIIIMPPFGHDGPDIAFIVLERCANELERVMHLLDKQFFNFDDARAEYEQGENYYHTTNSIWLIKGFVNQGKEEINNRRTLYYKHARPYEVFPDFNHVQKRRYVYARQGEIEIDIIRCPIVTNDNHGLPNDFTGMSGAGVWNVIFDECGEIVKVKLVGLATWQISNNLYFQGPTSLYESFYNHMLLTLGQMFPSAIM